MSSVRVEEKRMKIVVTTPTGNIGSKLVPILLERGADVTVIARHPDKVKELAARGVKVVKGEHSNVDVLKEAVQSADSLFFLIPPPYGSHDPIGDYRRFGETAAQVASTLGNLHIVFLSSAGANRVHGTGLIEGLYQAEEKLRSATKNVTALRANLFMENVLSSIPTIIKDGAIYGVVSGSKKLPQVATADIAEIAADVLLARQAGQHIIDVTGPEDISFDQAAQYIGTAIGKPVRNVVIPADALERAAIQMGFTPEVAREFVTMQQAIDTGLGQEFHGEERRRGKIHFGQFVRDVFVPVYQQAKRGAAA
jgi:uncharacterized protein YbjT (DUF2867 family)